MKKILKIDQHVIFAALLLGGRFTNVKWTRVRTYLSP